MRRLHIWQAQEGCLAPWKADQISRKREKHLKRMNAYTYFNNNKIVDPISILFHRKMRHPNTLICFFSPTSYLNLELSHLNINNKAYIQTLGLLVAWTRWINYEHLLDPKTFSSKFTYIP